MSAVRAPVAFVCLALVSAGVALNWHSFGSRGAATDRIEFNRDIRPILSQNCMSCHGGVKQQGNVSFIYREQALGKGKSGRPIVVPGNPHASELIARVISKDPETRMPYHAPPLQPKQIELLKDWIKQGARWEEYWSFVPPKPQPLPAVKRNDWVKRPVDRFILARLEKEGLDPSPEADKAALLRRVSFDLTGLPPTPEELSAFLSDPAPDAYEKQVDRLLASPRYGERWAAMWLDLARYADSRGYAGDLPRPGMWAYRDWVINAFNRNMPYDQFVITQLAGDLLPNWTLENHIATALHRQTPVNDEGGTDNEEFRLVAVLDRVATTWSVLNGVTINCVQCHSHPYDPIRHVEYYKFLAFFNTSRDWDLPDDSPVVRVPKEKTLYGEAARLQERISAVRRAMTEINRQQAAGSDQWRPLPIVKASLDEMAALQVQLSQLQAGKLLRDEQQEYIDNLAQDDPKGAAKLKAQFLKEGIEGITATIGKVKAKLADGTAPVLAVRNGEAWTSEQDTPNQSVYELTARVDGPITALRIEVPPMNPSVASHTPEAGFIVDRTDAWEILPGGHEKKVEFRYFAADSESNLKWAEGVGPKRSMAGGFAANPKLFQTRWIVGIPSSPLNLMPGSHIKVRLTQTRTIEEKPAIVRRVRLFASKDSSWASFADSPALVQSLDELERLEGQLANVPGVDLPVMVEEAGYERRATLEFERGNFLTKTGPALLPDMPKLFPALPAGAPRNRLTMANWFFAPGQPLTARVAVNRYWEQMFGTGIVETLEDFGSAGQGPSHPELIDWLALHFENDLHWDMKALLRELATSATYRQSASVQPALLSMDRRNRLLARGPQQRLTAEMVRDQALFASGLLNPTMGGPPVKPPMPAGVVPVTQGVAQWVDSKGSDRYRRAVYTYMKRAAIYPSFLTFDASSHDVSLARRIPTNTPLQALVTLNDPVYNEAAEALGARMLKEAAIASGGNDSDEPTALAETRLAYGARLVLSRDVTADELAILRSLYEDTLGTAAAPINRQLTALTAVASALLNLDAALTR